MTSTNPPPPAPARSCGDCAMCCKLGEIPDFKPFNQWCQYCPTHAGCGIYETRPQPCRNFHCHYLTSAIGEEWRPKQCGMVVSTYSQPLRMLISVDTDHPLPWARAPFLQQMQHWATQRFVTVMLAEHAFAVYPDRIEDLGILASNETIEITEGETISGTLIRSAKRVVKRG